MAGSLWWYEGTPDYAAYTVAWQKAVAFTNFFEPTPRPTSGPRSSRTKVPTPIRWCASSTTSAKSTGVTGTLSTANGSATLTSSYSKTDKLGDAVSCSVNATGTWNATSLWLDLTGSFSCVARTHKEAGTFTSQSQWIDMGSGYLQLLSTPTWKAAWASSSVDTYICETTCTSDLLFKPSRLTP